MTPEEEQALIASLQANHESTVSGPENVDFADPERLELLQQTFNLSDDEVAQIAVPTVAEGPSLADRLEALRPGINIGPLELTVDGSIEEPRIEGKVRF